MKDIKQLIIIARSIFLLTVILTSLLSNQATAVGGKENLGYVRGTGSILNSEDSSKFCCLVIEFKKSLGSKKKLIL